MLESMFYRRDGLPPPPLPEAYKLQTISPRSALLIAGVMLACTVIVQLAAAVFVSF